MRPDVPIVVAGGEELGQRALDEPGAFAVGEPLAPHGRLDQGGREHEVAEAARGEQGLKQRRDD